MGAQMRTIQASEAKTHLLERGVPLATLDEELVAAALAEGLEVVGEGDS